MKDFDERERDVLIRLLPTLVVVDSKVVTSLGIQVLVELPLQGGNLMLPSRNHVGGQNWQLERILEAPQKALLVSNRKIEGAFHDSRVV